MNGCRTSWHARFILDAVSSITCDSGLTSVCVRFQCEANPKWFLQFVMHLRMPGQRGLSRKATTADFAHNRLLPRMYPKVFGQVIVATKRTITDLANERLLASARHHADAELAPACLEADDTRRADVSFGRRCDVVVSFAITSVI